MAGGSHMKVRLQDPNPVNPPTGSWAGLHSMNQSNAIALPAIVAPLNDSPVRLNQP